MSAPSRVSMGAAFVVLLASSSGCATSIGGNGSLAPAASSPSWMACGATIFLERSPEASHDSRMLALQSDLDWYVEAIRTDLDVATEVPLELYVELPTSAIESLPASERALGPDDLARVEARSATTKLGIVEITPDADGGYYVSEFSFAPQHPEQCEKD